jgi:hypothetical protein
VTIAGAGVDRGREICERPGVKIALCMPIHSGGKPGFIQSLGRMIDHTHRTSFQDEKGQRVELAFESLVTCSSSIAHSRNAIAAEALEWGANWLFWLDADQTFPADALVRLLARRVPVVGCNYRRRAAEVHLPTASVIRDGKSEPLIAEGDGIVEVDHLGLGVCLVSAAVLRKVERPWFRFEETAAGALIGEDAYFFRKLRAAGFIPYVDQALSRQIGHIADIELML